MNDNLYFNYSKTREDIIEALLKIAPDDKEFFEPFISMSLNAPKMENLMENLSLKTIGTTLSNSINFIKNRKEKLKINVEEFQSDKKYYTKIEILTDNNPFIVDSVASILSSEKLNVIFSIQPVFSYIRDNGKLINISKPEETSDKELYLLFVIDAIDNNKKNELIKSLKTSIEECRLSVDDFKNMEHNIKSIVRQLNDPIYLKKISEKETEDIKEFLLWLLDGNFIFLGMRDYNIEEINSDTYIQVDKNRCFGILRDAKKSKFVNKTPIKELPSIVQKSILESEVVLIDKTNSKSNVYDIRRMDFISVSSFNKDLKVVKRHAILGLFTPKALQEQSFNIPFLKSKLDRILFREDIVEDSFEYKHMIEIFNTLPKDDLFITNTETLRELLENFLACETEERISIYVRDTNLLHGAYLIAVLPTKFYSQKNLDAFTKYLKGYFKTDDIEYKIITQSSRIIRIHYYLSYDKESIKKINTEKIEKDFRDIASNWQDNFYSLVVKNCKKGKASYIINKYMPNLTDEYMSTTSPERAIFDLPRLEALLETNEQQSDMYYENNDAYFNIYSLTKTPLHEILLKLNNMGLKVLYEEFTSIKVEGKNIFIQRFSIDPSNFNLDETKKLFETIRVNFEAIWNKVIEDDMLNKLTTKSIMHYKYIDLLRAMGNYLMQVNFQIKKSSFLSIMNKYPHISSMLVDYFEAKFAPNKADEANINSIHKSIKNAIEAISDIHEYKVMSSMLNIIESMLRTNFYKEKKYHYISFKIDSSKILTMPSPRPLFEIYVHSYFMEGCHLRGGKVARGGIRWSDRKDDFRLEILGLMKTQMVKNAVIVPVGSKGGFILKYPPAERDKFKKMGEDAYKTLMRGLLDITDSFGNNNEKIFPENVICYDEFDPYLVVAADKGTASFSDIANDISENEYGFWLRDAFASGGKHGYDHKAVGITARGAWECVKRHFREIGKNIEKETFDVVGIGDMSGDVFGNGMIITDNILLKGAFNHIEIFIDPQPDPKLSYAERLRLFKNRLTWSNYNKDLLSKGGFICSRNEKSVRLTPEAKNLLKTDADQLSGEEIIKLILQADVDLLWNGGIGTYVKSEEESNEDVGDRVNDSVRINADQLRAKIVGEGGNLGFTQKARIEYALSGGRINTDALDNSGGVDMSDHEVNLKILFSDLIKKKEIKDLNERNKLLKQLTGEVTQRVLTHNYMQSFGVSLDEYRSKKEPDIFYKLNKVLKNKGLMHEGDYPTPTRKELSSRVSRGIGYTRPELSIMMALAKMFIYDELLKSNIFSEDIIEQYATMYFPPYVRKTYEKYIGDHILKNEIAFTFIVNLIMNNNGAASLMKINMLTGNNYPIIMQAMIFAYNILNALEIREELFSYENKISQTDIYKISLDIFDSIHTLTIYQLYLFGSASLDKKRIEEVKSFFEDYKTQCIANGVFKVQFHEKVDYLSKFVNKDFSKKIANLYFLDDFIPAFNISRLLKKNITEVVESIENVKNLFGLKKIMDYINRVPISNEWDRLAQFSIIKNYIRSSVIISTKIVKEFDGNANAFIKSNENIFEEYINDLNAVMGIRSTNLHPAMLLYDKLQKIIK